MEFYCVNKEDKRQIQENCRLGSIVEKPRGNVEQEGAGGVAVFLERALGDTVKGAGTKG